MSSEIKETNKLLIVGRIPPPYGGVTVHISRLLSHLQALDYPFEFCALPRSSNHKSSILQKLRKFIKPACTLLFHRYDVVHCHASNPWLFILVDLISGRLRRGKIIHTLHGEGILLACECGPPYMKCLLRFAFKRASQIIAINTSCAQRVRPFAASPAHVILMSAYIPPGSEEMETGQINSELETFFNKHPKCFASQGNFGNMYQGKDLYRFDLLANALVSIRATNKSVGLCSVVSQTLSNSARNDVLNLRRQLGLEDHWLIIEDFGSAIPLYRRCIGFIRPTMSDGDSLSIRECLDLGVPVIASNAVPRPEGCVIFESGNLHSLEATLLDVLSEYPQFTLLTQQTERENCLQSLLSCYQSVSSGQLSTSDSGVT